MIPQTRDEEICLFLKRTGLATTAQIEQVYFSHCKYSGNVVRKRMTKLYDAGLVKRDRHDESSPYLYWVEGKKPSQIDHRLLVTDILVYVLKMVKKEIGYLETWDREPQLEGLRPDVFCKFIIPIRDRKRQCNRFFEVERWTGNEFNQAKFENYYSSGNWKSLGISQFPKVVVVTDKKIKIEDTDNHINYVIIPTNLSGLDATF